MSVVHDGSKVVLPSPGAFAAAVPARVGFYPSESLVAVFLGKGQVIVTMRLDLPESWAEVAGYVASTGTRVEADEVILAVCSSKGEGDLPHREGVAALITACHQANVIVKDAMLIDGERFWSFMCRSVECCPPEGTPIPEDTSVEVEQVGHGLPAVASSRDAVIERFLPRPDLAPSQEVRSQAEAIFGVPVGERAQQAWDAVKMLAANPQLGDHDAADLLRSRIQVAMGDVRVRDFVLAHVALNADGSDGLVEVVVQAALTAPEDLRPRLAGAASALLASCGTSSIAVSCLLDLAEGESLADLVRTSQGMAVPPSTLRDLFQTALPQVVAQLRKADARKEISQ